MRCSAAILFMALPLWVFGVANVRAEPLDGRLRGFAEPVPSDGSFSQSVPLDVPEFRGVQPQLSLDYSSGGWNGPIGLGWRLSGMPAITNRPAEGTRGRQEYMFGDAELVSCDAVVGASPACEGGDGDTYATKVETYLRVRRALNIYPNYDNWVVSYPDGRTALYDRVAPGYSRWVLSSMSDPLGNKVTYHWDCPVGDAEGRCYPDQIQYNPYHPVVIRFFYEDRPDPVAYPSAGLVDRSLKKLVRRLRSVLVQVDGENLRVYTVQYALSAATGRSLVSSVHQYGRDVRLDVAGGVIAGSRLPLSPAFDYEDLAPSNAFASVASTTMPALYEYQSVSGGDTGLRNIDLNGDGLQDLIRVSPDARNAWINENGTWRRDDSYAANLPSFVRNPNSRDCYVAGIADIDGDGLTDIVEGCPASGGFHYVLLNTRAGFERSRSLDLYLGYGNGPVYLGPWDVFVDLNGDHRADLLRFGLNQAYYSGGASGWGGVIKNYGPAGFPTDARGVEIADVNGDGLPDVLQARRTTSNGVTTNATGAWLNLGYGFVSEPLFDPPALFEYVHTKTGDTGLRVADLNGDGMADLLQSHRGVWAGNTQWTTRQGAWISTGTGWKRADAYASNVGYFSYDGCPNGDTGQRLVDMNGDGTVDIVRSFRGSVNGASWATYTSVQTGQFVNRDIMTVATSRLGGEISVAYVPSTYWPGSSLPMSIPTVSRLTVKDRRGVLSEYLYAYKSAAYDGKEQVFLGFAEVDETLPAHAPGSNGSKRTTYVQNIATLGRPSEHRVLDESGKLVRRVLFEYDTNNQIPYGSQLTSRRDFAYQYHYRTVAGIVMRVTESVETGSDYFHDDYGNLTTVIDLGSVQSMGDELRTDYVYHPNLSAYILNRVAQTSRREGTLVANPLLQRENRYYDNFSSHAAQPAKGLLTYVQTWLGDAFGYTRAGIAYNARGDIVSISDASNNRTEIIRADGYLVSEIRDPLYWQDPHHRRRYDQNLCLELT